MSSNHHGIKKDVLKKGALGIILGALIAISIFLLPFNHTWQIGQFKIKLKPRETVFTPNIQEISINPNAPKYALPVNLSEVEYLDLIIEKLQSYFGYSLSEEALAKLSQNGFVVISISPMETNWDMFTHFEYFYSALYISELPIFITTDSVLHIYHVFYMSLLKKAEEEYFIPWLDAILSALIDYMKNLYENLSPDYTVIKQAAYETLAFFCIAERLLNPGYQVPGEVFDVVTSEISLIMNASGVFESPLFGYLMDYTLFKPRGYYTSSEKLERYFRSMMWLGYAYFDLKSVEKTIDAILLTVAVDNTYATIAGSQVPVRDLWEKIYLVTAFFVGYSDDLTIYDYEKAILEVFGSEFSIEDLMDTTKIELVMNMLEEMDQSKIRVIGERRPGLRFMGQRITPDSYIMQSLVDPSVPNRMFPKGLDVMAVLDSSRAELHLSAEKETYPGYSEKLNELKTEFNSLSVKNWTQNLYWSWLYTIKANLKDDYTGYPTFMQTDAWLDEKLNTALGSWTELRHDTILYVKQSNTLIGIPEALKGYVEPMPEVYNRLLALCNATMNGLVKLGILEDYVQYIAEFRDILYRLLDISIKELQNILLTESDYGFIKSFGYRVAGILEQIGDAQSRTLLIADVHTCYDIGTMFVLEEANGFIEPIIVIYMDSDGTLRAAVGGVFSYYEFISNNRLTDEEWINYLQSGNIPVSYTHLTLPTTERV